MFNIFFFVKQFNSVQMTNIKKTPLDKKKLTRTIIISVLGFMVLIMSVSFINRIFANPTVAASVAALPLQDNNAHNVSQVQLQVLNACGVEGLAKRVKDYLVTKGFAVSDVGNYSGAVDKSFLIDRSGDLQNSVKITEALGIDKNLIKVETAPLKPVINTIIIGNDFSSLKPFK